MYFQTNDMLNNTVLGIPKEDLLKQIQEMSSNDAAICTSQEENLLPIDDDTKRQMIASMIWESPKYGTHVKEQLLEYFSKLSS